MSEILYEFDTNDINDTTPDEVEEALVIGANQQLKTATDDILDDQIILDERNYNLDSKEVAAAMGVEYVLPDESQIFVDWDEGIPTDKIIGVKEMLSKFGYTLQFVRAWPSRSKHKGRHGLFRIWYTEQKPDDWDDKEDGEWEQPESMVVNLEAGERIAMQLLLGSDPTRELFSIIRVFENGYNDMMLRRESYDPTVFFEKKGFVLPKGVDIS